MTGRVSGNFRQRLEIAVARRILRLPPRLRPRASPCTVDGYTLDEDVQWLLRLFALSRKPGLHELSVEEARREFAMLPKICEAPAPDIRDVTDLVIEQPTHAIGLRRYSNLPDMDETRHPAFVFFHGGGGVVGDIETHDTLCRVFAKRSGAVVLSVDYRLAPEHPWPAAVDDAELAFAWIVDNAEVLGIDRDRIAVGGDSLGGCLAAIVAQCCEAPGPCFQVLIYPVTDVVNPSLSRQRLRDGYLLTGDLIEWFGTHYMAGADGAHPRLSPGLANDLAHVPPALVVTAGFDPLRDEAVAYADKLEAAGVEVDRRCYRGLPHGFVALTGVVSAARAAVEDIAEALGSALEADTGRHAR